MKKITVVLLIFVCFFNTFAQSVIIKSSIEWRATNDATTTKIKFEKTPFLKLEYINNTKKSIYFKKIPTQFNFPCFILLNKTNEFSEINKFNKILLNKKNKIVLSDFNAFSTTWELLDGDYQNNEEEYAISIYNNYLTAIYSFYDANNEKKVVPFLYGNNKLKISKENILSSLKEYFIFLKPNQCFEDYFDLTGFCFLGGTYTFSLRDQDIKDYVITNNYWDGNQNKMIYNKEFLPLEINGFKLFKGKIKTNEISINFD